ncbi:MAG TPA: sigma-54 dependent transcriptional regulator [Rectinemataceae bacterium]|nr:sigma-54 dependent transcriptional regulator [Rectinemataceae bacterium]
MKILVVEDDRSAGELLRDALASVGWVVGLSMSGTEAGELLDREPFDVVVADVDLPGMSGIEIAKKALAELRPAPRFILVSGQDRIIESVNSLELGVDDFLPKPINLKRLIAIIRRIDERRYVPQIVPAEEIKAFLKGSTRVDIDSLPEPKSLLAPGEAPFIGVYGAKMLAVCERLKKVAPYPDIPVLIEGETGTGKELAARYVSIVDQESEGPFVGLNCSLFNSEFFAAELFGYEHGAFTGAAQKGKTGKLDLAAGGCLFLDEITEMSADLQSRLLRVLEERNFYRLGGDKLIDVSCRFVFATNRDIRRLVSDRIFRQDLFYRLSLCMIRVPPLRERKEEILPLAVRFIRALKAGSRLRARHVETAAFDILEAHEWPGNARELQNVISSWALFETGDTLRLSSLEEIVGSGRFENPADEGKATVDESPKKGIGLADIAIPDEPFELAALEKEIVRKTLEKFGGNKARTAEFLGISRSQLYDKFR